MNEGRIRVTVNGEERDVDAGLSVEQLLLSFDLHPRLVVVERNGDILRRESYAEVGIEPGDTLELVHFVGGG